MKKTVISFLLMLASVSAFSQNFDFKMDDDGEVFVSGQIVYEDKADLAWSRLKSYINETYTTENNEVTIDNDARCIIITGGLENSKFRYNPITGSYQDDVMYSLVLTQDLSENVIKYEFKDLFIKYTVRGFNNSSNIIPVRKMLKDYKKVAKIVADESIKIKDKKEEINQEKDLRSSLEKAYEKYMERVTKIEESME